MPGHLVRRIARRREWSERAKLFCAFGVSSIWPFLLIVMARYGSAHSTRWGPEDPREAPVYVLLGAVTASPVLFAVALPLAYLGIHLAGRHRTR